MRTTDISRRRFLAHLAATTTTAGMVGMIPGGLRSRLLASGFVAEGNNLRIPGIFSGGEIVAAQHSQGIWSDRPTNVWTLGGSYPAPTIRVNRGERFTAVLRNELAEETNIHWHGLLVPADMDGHAMDVAAPGATKNFDFVVDQRAGIYWYHPHPDMKTGRQVFKGMAGFFLVSDQEEQALALPRSQYEIPLMIQDRRERADREFDYNLEMPDQMAGMLGNTILANGTPNAELNVEATTYRLRLLNGSNARVYKIAMSDQREFHVIGTDCGLLDRPYPVRSLFLGPAERIDLLVHLSGDAVGSSVRLVAETFNGAIDWTMQGWGGDILKMNVTGSGPAYQIPTTLATLEKLDPASASRTRRFTLKMVTPMPERGMHTINDRIFDHMRIDETVRAGDMEIWEFVNETEDEPHPIHTHGAQFQILDRDGVAVSDPADMGWKDTVTVWPNQTVRVVIKFGEHPGVFMLHCHNLEHEDDGMMMNFLIEPATSGVEDRGGEDVLPTKMDLW